MDIVDIKSKEICQMAGRGISRLRQTSQISLETLAQRAGCTAKDVANIENCTSDPSLRTVIKIAGVFGVNILYLMSGADLGQTAHISLEPCHKSGPNG